MNHTTPGSSSRYTFTVFTAVYNARHKLDRVYRSLCAQTYRDFEWLVIDDGSTDGSRELIESWAQDAPFPMRYEFQKNQGKHVAFNRGVELARGALFLNLDHDDACVPQALERHKHHWDSIPAEQRDRFTGVTCLCMDEQGRAIGTRFPKDVTDSDSLEIRHRYHVEGEKWGFHRIEVLRRFPFPDLDGERFLPGCPVWIPESVVWKMIAREYKTRYVNEALRVFYEHDPNQGTRLSKGTHAKHVIGGIRQCADELNNDLDWFRFDGKYFLKSAGNYGRWSLHKGLSLLEQWRGLKPAGAKLLWLAMLPVAYLLYLRDRRHDAGLKRDGAVSDGKPA